MRRFLLMFIVVVDVYGIALNTSNDFISSSTELEQYSSNEKTSPIYRTYSIPTYPEYVMINSHDKDEKNENNENDERLKLLTTTSSQVSIDNWSTAVAKSLVPVSSFLILFGTKAAIYAMKIIGFSILSLGITTFICTFTSLCTISFKDIRFTKKKMEESVASHIDVGNLNENTTDILGVIEKFEKLQSTLDKKMEIKGIEKSDNDTVVNSSKKRRRRYI